MIEVRNLVKQYATTTALAGLSFEVPEREIFGFVGPNGAGKTTSIKILATLLSPTSGTAVIDGVDVARDPEAVRGRIGYMPDFFGVYDALTAGEYLAFYASCYRVPRERVSRIVSDLLELIGLPDKRNEPVDTLSRGMKQRLCLARALVHDPSVLLLDEPASGLDPRARVEMRELLSELRDMGKTIVVSSHILPELAEMCTSFGIVDRGRMVATGPLDALLGNRDRRRARVVVAGDAGEIEDVVRAIPGVHEVAREGNVLEVSYDGTTDEASASLLATLVARGVSVAAFTPMDESLEELFLRVTGGEAA